jgi:hemerythrin-like domain-containing protein
MSIQQKKDKYVDPLKRVIECHENVSEFVENYHKILSFSYENEGWDNIKRIENFFNQNIIHHFEFEEKKIFPVILLKTATPEYVGLILELQREHGIILKEVDLFKERISKNPDLLNKETSREIYDIVKKIKENIQRHAAKEDEKILPFLKKNRHIFI